MSDVTDRVGDQRVELRTPATNLIVASAVLTSNPELHRLMPRLRRSLVQHAERRHRGIAGESAV
jgi:hypothetical protein